ncbi:transposase [Actinoplanes xinjiangensis]|uniref:transposase n=1 Tax=Actinoplanes xinjiangensis TaxID=512350 RepID=UPI00341C1CEA
MLDDRRTCRRRRVGRHAGPDLPRQLRRHTRASRRPQLRDGPPRAPGCNPGSEKGAPTVGVQRQYSGTAGKIGNCQLAVYPSYASPLGHTLVDVALYLPKSWTEDAGRRAGAGCRRGHVRDETAAGPPSDPSGDQGPAVGPMGRQRRSLRRRPTPGRRTPRLPPGLRPRGRLLAPRHDRPRQTTCRPDRSRTPQARMAADLRTRRGQRPPLLRLGAITLPLAAEQHQGHHCRPSQEGPLRQFALTVQVTPGLGQRVAPRRIDSRKCLSNNVYRIDISCRPSQ